MKKIISFVLAAVLLVSAVPTALATNDYTQGTQVVYTATGSESYTITVPAQLAPGGSGTVTLQGTWADNRIITVTADPTVTLTNSIKAEDQKVLNVHFDGIHQAGSNTGSQTFTESVSVDNITNALFGTWSGKFNYNVELENQLKTLKFDEAYVVVEAQMPSQTPYGSWETFHEDGSSDGYLGGGGPGTYTYTDDIIYFGPVSDGIVRFVILEDGKLAAYNTNDPNDPWYVLAPESSLPLVDIRLYTEDGTIDETLKARAGIKWMHWVDSEYNTIGAYMSDPFRYIIIPGGYECKGHDGTISAQDIIEAGEYLLVPVS